MSRVNHILRTISLPVAIHCWGGLGSQLYAVAIRLVLEREFPTRRFYFVAHQSGVTQRKCELESYFPGTVDIKEDFVPKSKTMSQSKLPIPRSLVRKCFLSLLYKSHLIVNGDLDSYQNQIKSWTMQIRGHYSENYLDGSVIEQIARIFFFESHEYPEISDSVALHFRLGDLVHLNSKSPIEPKRLIEILERIQRETAKKIMVFSDSPALANQLLIGTNLRFSIAKQQSPIETLKCLANSKIFVGTNSKLSVWSTLFASINNSESICYLPNEVRHHVQANLCDIQSVNYY